MTDRVNSMIISAFIFCSPIPAFSADTEAPFGFEWGQSKQQISSSGVTLTDCSLINANAMNFCITKNPPKSVSFGDEYGLIIDLKMGLQKVIMVSKTIKSDIYGTDGKKQFASVESALTKKYGKHEEYKKVGLKLYQESDEFYQCLDYQGCGFWASFWQNNDQGTVTLELNGTGRRGEGFLKLTYESKDWGKAFNAAKKIETTSDASAL